MTLPTSGDGPVRATDYLEGHVNCRCTLIPRAKSYADVLGDPMIPDNRPPILDGETEFGRLPLNIQHSILGPGKFDLYRAGAPLDAFTQRHVSGQWGASRVARPLKDIMARLEQGGWQTGDMFPPDIADEYRTLNGTNVQPRPTPVPAPVPAPGPVVVSPSPEPPVPATKGPGDFETEDELKEWWAREFPDIQLNISDPIDMEAANGVMIGLAKMKAEYPEGFGQMKAVNFKKITSGSFGDNVYAHVAGATLAPDGKTWISNGYSSSTSKHGAVMEFNTAEKMYGKKAQTVRRPLSAGERWTAEQDMKQRGGWISDMKALGFDPTPFMDGTKGRYDFLTDYAWPVTKNPELAKKLSDMWGGTVFTPSGLFKDYGAWRDAKELLDRGWIETTTGTRPLWQSIQNDIRSGFHPDIGVPHTGDLTREQQLRLVASVAIHEYGHVFDIDVMRKSSQFLTDALSATDWGLNINSFWTERVEKSMIGGAVSSYAKKNEFEKFAETFAAINLQPKDQWKPYTKKIARLIEFLRKADKWDKADVNVAPYGTNIQNITNRWKSLIAKDKINREYGEKVFPDVDTNWVKFAPHALRIIRERLAADPNLTAYRLNEIVNDALFNFQQTGELP